MQVHDQLATMDVQQLRDFAAALIDKVGRQDQELQRRQLKIEQLTHEMAVMRCWKFAARSEQLHGAQRHLFEEAIDADLEAIGRELTALAPIPPRDPRSRYRGARRCRRTCRASTSATSRSAPCAAAAVRCSASART